MEAYDLDPEELSTLMGLSLALAAKVGQLALVQRLLAAGVNPNAVDEERRSALLLACGAPTTQPFTLEVIKALLDAGANPNHAPMGIRPLNSVLNRDNPNVEVVKALLEAGADANADARLLPLAVEIHDVAIVRALIAAGADVGRSVPVHSPDQRETPFEVAARRQRVDVAQMLVDAGAALPEAVFEEAFWERHGVNNPVRRIVNAHSLQRTIEQVMAHDEQAAAPRSAAPSLL